MGRVRGFRHFRDDMARSHAAPWIVIAVRGVRKGPVPYIRSEALVACAILDVHVNSTLQTTPRNEGNPSQGHIFRLI